jgi:hypothetical protein
MTTAAQVQALERAIKEFDQVVARHFRGEPAIRVSIPARPDVDSDLVISAGMQAALAALQSPEPSETLIPAEMMVLEHLRRRLEEAGTAELGAARERVQAETLGKALRILAAEPSGPVETPPDRFKLAQLLNRLGDIEEYLRAGASNVALREVTRLMADMEATAARDTAPPQAEPLVCHNPAQDMRDAGLLLAPEHTSAAEPPETPPFAAPAPPGFRWLKECRVNAAGNYDTGWYLHRIAQAEPSADGPPADLVALVREWQAAKATIRRIFDAWDSGDDGPSDAGVLGPVVQRRKDAEAALISYPLPAEQAPR